MKAVQTFWTHKDADISQMSGGWIDIRFHLLSWALSASLLKQYFQNVVLHTDLLGKQILIDTLQLPYDEVHLTQEHLGEKYPPELWVMRKMHTYSLMRAPFLHVDGDAYFFRPLPENLLNTEVIVQNFQFGFPCYPKAVQQLESVKIPLPNFISPARDQYDAVNMGVIGGKAPQLFKSFFKNMDEYMGYYRSQIAQNYSSIDIGYLNTLLEECCFFYYVQNSGGTIVPFLSKEFEETYAELGNLMDNRYDYFHLIGSHKKNLFYCKLVNNKLKTLFPDTHDRVMNFVNSVIGNIHANKPYSSQDPFAESNARLKEKGYMHTISVNNCLSQHKKFQRLNETQICETILFEKEKHLTVQEQLRSKAEHIVNERSRFELYVKYLALLPIHLRYPDVIQYNEHMPVFCRKVTEGPHTNLEVYLSLVFDFNYGFEHVDQKTWDDLSIFILCTAASQKVSIEKLLNSVFQKAAPSTSEKRAEIITRVDLRLKELFLLGLIDYTITTPTDKYSKDDPGKDRRSCSPVAAVRTRMSA